MISNTENFAVIMLYPVSMDLGRMYQENMHPLRGMAPLEGPTRIYIMDLRNGNVISGISTDPGISFSTHHVNAWEEGDEIVIDYASNMWSNMPNYLNFKNIMSEDKGNIVPTFLMKRARINIKTKEVKVHDWKNALEIPYINYLEFPNINTNYNGIRNRFVYGWIGIDNQRQGLVKKDLEDSRNDKVWSVPFHYPGEPFFVANTGKDEDDGIVLSIVYDGTFKKSYILLLDGKTFDVSVYYY
ncbi:carotenoid cleavage dioxygenase 8 homolog B, chloroplastic isoform X2 [Eurytemora carolleeae]|uniref:carotenoid cleavage dioxygenase 8 homolog B, chloroplastic isoform X2 n=1 Tax=Eurytemora carolleeae TaxID=1294199 RepID=UPI000C771216|nr:carotenoid cleavage dioxygenase 8 homolog B, chloroplastic isoform X2 [Eurytemora carolleeae]|eukprot:XP_023330185.1 carotenoid cleavage dioxygenase 8 homolog B, chloroplastic-like isoform X2 [Eurytemora affinis]